jgi:DNA-binding response OmpR family regulator
MAKVLIVEDDVSLATNLADKLRADGLVVLLTHDGEAGLDKIRTEPSLDLIILDIMLPKLDGLSICRMVRHDPATAHIPIIMLTARSAEVDKIIGLESGADDYVVKPFGLGEMLARVRSVMRRGPGRSMLQQDQIEIGTLRVNMTARLTYKSEQKVELSNKEFDLLVELMRNRNVVLSRDLILTKVWGYDYFVDKRTVDVHIRWLREKIEDDPSNPRHIITVRGVGYRFEG